MVGRNRSTGADVSIRAPVRGRRQFVTKESHLSGFNPRPREGATIAASAKRAYRAGFNPRPREGATGGDIWGGAVGAVSIRAPVRGRRLSPDAHRSSQRFQSAPP
mgnify:CR=1 FL=1